MKRTKYLVGIALTCTLAVAALLTGCTQSDRASASMPTHIDEPAVASDGLPVIVITAPRPRNIAISELPSATAPN
jgi:nitrous oxide reductase accessory protein NosL